MPRGRPRKPWTQKVFELLEDGEWHDIDRVILSAAGLVPPGVAYRYAEKYRAASYERRGVDVKPSRKDMTALAFTGARSMVRVSIANTPFLEISDDHRQIRIKPRATD